MSKPIRLILCGTLLLCCCKGYQVSIVPTEAQTHSRAKKALDNLQKENDKTQEKITLTADEQKKFDSLKHAFEKVIEKLQDQIQGCQNGNKSKCNNFWTWLDGHIQKQKELANAFTKVYEFLEDKRKKHENNKTFDSYISDAIDCKVNNQCNNADNKYGTGNNDIEQFFRGVLNDISTKNHNEEMFECLKKELLDSTNHVAGLTANWQ
ncbi:Mlp family lipoprotein (plasmid) [Borrelia hermsii]|uniref:Family 113-like protein n=4 Tax=Borrelia hermsii TaxID=140 RepID=Q1CNY1_BORHD|nr:Mlp family lipoprotein [Borrelia hermsii]AAV88061.1 BBQ35-like protein [Borrelia hermsii]ABF82180.1 family 113-like protein [Borrelia hermsii DAH]AHH14741.1 Mlp lipoprotein family protein [Borrelia hermsii MTW]AMR76104.1 hypothetical protein A0V01_05790 [Borrelia hermsii]UPA08407.1 Mlp family lipoprotein [Borrelia hermsii DAH]